MITVAWVKGARREGEVVGWMGNGKLWPEPKWREGFMRLSMKQLPYVFVSFYQITIVDCLILISIQFQIYKNGQI